MIPWIGIIHQELYHAGFRDAPLDSLMGEATPNYVYWQRAAGRIHTYNPGIKLIISFRDPVARTYSQWRMHVVHGSIISSFSDIIRDARSHVIAEADTEEQPAGHFSYIARSLYATQIERRRWI